MRAVQNETPPNPSVAALQEIDNNLSTNQFYKKQDGSQKGVPRRKCRGITHVSRSWPVKQDSPARQGVSAAAGLPWMAALDWPARLRSVAYEIHRRYDVVEDIYFQGWRWQAVLR